MGNVTPLGDVADRYDSLVAYNERFFDNWVEEHRYTAGSMVLASTALAFMQFAQTFTDVGRVGNGLFVEGGWKGVGKDILRTVNIAGSAGAALGRVGAGLRVVQQSQSGLCTFVAQANALRRTGHRLLITAEDLIKRTGGNVDVIFKIGSGAQEYSGLLTWLDKAKIPYEILLRSAPRTERTFLALETAIRRGGGVVTFGVKSTGRLSAKGEVVSRDHLVHRLYAEFSRTRGLEIRDPLGPTFKSFRELSAWYRDLELSAAPLLLIRNSTLVMASHAAQRVTEATVAAQALSFHIMPFVKVPASDARTAAQTLMVHDRYSTTSGRARAGTHSVASGDTLSAIAQKHYGSASKWPLLYVANHDLIGSDPDKIKPGQKLTVPEEPQVRQNGDSTDRTIETRALP